LAYEGSTDFRETLLGEGPAKDEVVQLSKTLEKYYQSSYLLLSDTQLYTRSI